MKTKFTLLIILAIATSITAIAQTPKNYHIDTLKNGTVRNYTTYMDASFYKEQKIGTTYNSLTVKNAILIISKYNYGGNKSIQYVTSPDGKYKITTYYSRGKNGNSILKTQSITLIK